MVLGSGCHLRLDSVKLLVYFQNVHTDVHNRSYLKNGVHLEERRTVSPKKTPIFVPCLRAITPHHTPLSIPEHQEEQVSVTYEWADTSACMYTISVTILVSMLQPIRIQILYGACLFHLNNCFGGNMHFLQQGHNTRA